jgi:hypothetical protein
VNTAPDRTTAQWYTIRSICASLGLGDNEVDDIGWMARSREEADQAIRDLKRRLLDMFARRIK